MRVTPTIRRYLLHSLTLSVCLLGSSVLFADAGPDIGDPAIAAAIQAAVQEQQSQDPSAMMVSSANAVAAQSRQAFPLLDDNQASSAADLHQSEGPSIAPSTRLWNLQDADILSVINEVSQETGKNFVVDPRVTGKISLVSSKPLRKSEVYNVFLSVLELLGYSAIPSGNVIKIVPNMESGEMATRVASKQSPGRGDEVVVRVIPLVNITATQLIPVLRPMMPQWSNISAYTPGNVLILLGRADNLKRIANVIQAVDRAANNSIQMIPLKHASAVQVAQVLNNLQSASRAAGETASVSIAVDDRSNGILLSGPKQLRLRMSMLIAQLDAPAATAEGNTEVIYLRYLEAKTFAPLLGKIAQNILGKGDSTSASAGSSSHTSASTSSRAPANVSASASSSGKTSVPDMPENSTSIQAEPNSNAIIITAPPALMKALKIIVNKLDIRPAQVLVEAIIAEIDEDNLTSLGIQWGSVTAGGSVSTTNVGGLATSFPPLGAGIVGIMPSTQIQAVLSILQNQNGVDILSTPSVVVLDNQKATIEVGQDVPMQSGSYTSGSGSNAEGAVTPFTTIDRKPVTLKLDVTPQLNLGTSVRLKLDLKNDTLRNPQNPGLTPIVNTSKITNSVIINSNDILVLGGLISNSNIENINKVPILGSLPIIGQLFQQKVTNQQKKNLMVFIKPVIMQDGKDAMLISQQKYAEIRSIQANFRDELNDIGKKPVPTLLPPWKNNKDLPMPFEAPE